MHRNTKITLMVGMGAFVILGLFSTPTLLKKIYNEWLVSEVVVEVPPARVYPEIEVPYFNAVMQVHDQQMEYYAPRGEE